MALSNQQIERYSRQIIVPGVGGIAQERLLASKAALVGEAADLEPALLYLAGAGTGEIVLCSSSTGDPRTETAAAHARALNPDVRVTVVAALTQRADVMLALVGSEASRIAAERANQQRTAGAIVCARLDSPGRLAVIPSLPPCLVCAEAELLSRYQQRAEHAHLIGALATTEALKLMLGVAASKLPTLVEFSGFETVSKRPAHRSDCGVCGSGSDLGR